MHLRGSGPIAAILSAAAALTALPATGQGASERSPSAALLFGGPARWLSDADMHRQFLEHFRSAVGLGRSRMVSASLQLHDDMLLTVTVPGDEDASPPVTLRYELKNLELIGVAKHATPVAFVLSSHTDRSGENGTRALNTFERRALASLRSTDDVVAGETTRIGRNVVGVIRATGECLSCHPTSRAGDILGAFSYHLARVPTTGVSER